MKANEEYGCIDVNQSPQANFPQDLQEEIRVYSRLFEGLESLKFPLLSFQRWADSSSPSLDFSLTPHGEEGLKNRKFLNKTGGYVDKTNWKEVA